LFCKTKTKNWATDEIRWWRVETSEEDRRLKFHRLKQTAAVAAEVIFPFFNMVTLC
jgi:hypothetical protein